MVELKYMMDLIMDIIEVDSNSQKIIEEYFYYLDKKFQDFKNISIQSFDLILEQFFLEFKKNEFESVKYLNIDLNSINEKDKKYFKKDIKKFQIINKMKKLNKLFFLIQCYNKIIEPSKDYIFSPYDYFIYIKGKFSSYREEVIVTHLNQKNRIICNSIISIGNDKFAYISAREILIEVVNYKSSSIIISHNHPSGDSNPSQEDIKFTLKMKQIMDEVGIKLLDHIIVGESYFSMKRDGYI